MSAYTLIDAPQRSPEWYAARAGRLTGSCAADAIAFKKTGDKGETAERRKLRANLVCEVLTGRALDDDAFVTRALQRGIELEGVAAAAYEATSDAMVRWSGFLSHNTLMVGCSLDGHVGDPLTGIIEIKCPTSPVHLGYLLAGGVPDDYLPQATHNLWVSGAEWLDFVSFDDRFLDPALQLFTVRITREQVDIPAYEAKAVQFLAEVARDVEAVRSGKTFADVLREAAGVA
jgi:hypothetical protein